MTTTASSSPYTYTVVDGKSVLSCWCGGHEGPYSIEAYIQHHCEHPEWGVLDETDPADKDIMCVACGLVATLR